MEYWMFASMVVSALAMVVIAWYAIKTHKLASEIQSKDKEFRQEMSDLYAAIVISNLVQGLEWGSGALERKIKFFKEQLDKIKKTTILDSIERVE